MKEFQKNCKFVNCVRRAEAIILKDKKMPNFLKFTTYPKGLQKSSTQFCELKNKKLAKKVKILGDVSYVSGLNNTLLFFVGQISHKNQKIKVFFEADIEGRINKEIWVNHYYF